VTKAPVRVAFLASGGGSNVGALLAHRDSGAGMGEGKDRGGGAGGSPWIPALLVSDRETAPALERGREAGIPTRVVPPGDDFEARLAKALSEAAVDLAVLAGYLRLVPEGIVRRYQGRILNIHPSLLPSFGGKGMYGVRIHQAVLDAGVRMTGVTVHLVDARFDEGPILAQWPVPVEPGDDAQTLGRRVLAVEHRLFPVVVDHVARSLAAGRAPAPLPVSALSSPELTFP
jgi:phosphoribosylglycinamide formyltransferase 1